MDEATDTLLLGKNPIIATPDVHSEVITSDTDFAVLGTDGLFDIFEPQAVANFVKKCLVEKLDLQKTATSIVEDAISHGSIDNVSCIIVVFHAT